MQEPARASANPATVPVRSTVRRSITAYATPEVPRLMKGVAGMQPQTQRRGHMVAGAETDHHVRGEAELCCRGGPDDAHRPVRPTDTR